MEAQESIVIDDHGAANELGIAVQTLRNWRCKCRGPAYLKIGRSVRYQVKDIEEYKRKKRIDPEK